MDCSLPGSSVHGILQARKLEWVAMLFSRGSSWPRNWTLVAHIAGRFFTVWATREAPQCWLLCYWFIFQSSLWETRGERGCFWLGWPRKWGTWTNMFIWRFHINLILFPALNLSPWVWSWAYKSCSYWTELGCSAEAPDLLNPEPVGQLMKDS